MGMYVLPAIDSDGLLLGFVVPEGKGSEENVRTLQPQMPVRASFHPFREREAGILDMLRSTTLSPRCSSHTLLPQCLSPFLSITAPTTFPGPNVRPTPPLPLSSSARQHFCYTTLHTLPSESITASTSNSTTLPPWTTHALL